MTIDELFEEKKEYQSLKSKITSMVSKLGSFKTEITCVKTNVSANYLINNDDTILSNRISNLILNANNIRNYLAKNIIPAIDSEIKKCNIQINKLKAAEAQTTSQSSTTKSKSTSQKQTTSNNKNSNDLFSVYSEVNYYDI